MVFAIHQHESATDIHVSPPSWTHLPTVCWWKQQSCIPHPQTWELLITFCCHHRKTQCSHYSYVVQHLVLIGVFGRAQEPCPCPRPQKSQFYVLWKHVGWVLWNTGFPNTRGAAPLLAAWLLSSHLTIKAAQTGSLPNNEKTSPTLPHVPLDQCWWLLPRYQGQL